MPLFKIGKGNRKMERFISTSEWREFEEISEMFRNKIKEVRKKVAVITNIPCIEVVKDNKILEEVKLYKLDYSEVLRSIGCADCKSIYSFNKEKLEKIKLCMEKLTARINHELIEYFSQFEFKYHDKKTIETYCNQFGYKGFLSGDTPTIEECSDMIECFYTPETEFRANRHNKNRLPKENIHIEYGYTPKCSICGDGGCPSCEPWFFM